MEHHAEFVHWDTDTIRVQVYVNSVFLTVRHAQYLKMQIYRYAQYVVMDIMLAIQVHVYLVLATVWPVIILHALCVVLVTIWKMGYALVAQVGVAHVLVSKYAILV